MSFSVGFPAKLGKKIALCIGIIATALGALWLLQGLGVVQLRPILCFVDCAPVQGPSTTWVIVGAVMLSLGCCSVFWLLKR